jgi:DNA invertase Pin-like site-specific DNA recombinase
MSARVKAGAGGPIPAIAFLRRDAAGKVTKERQAVSAFAARAGYEIVAELSDEIDADILRSPGFARALRRVEATGAQTIILASVSSFARDKLVRAVGRVKLSLFGITLIAADCGRFPDNSVEDRLVKQMLDQVSAFDELLVTASDKGKSDRFGRKVGPKGRKQYVDLVPEAVSLAKRIYEMARHGETRVTLREISQQLADAGHVEKTGKPFHPHAIDRMIKGPNPRSAGHRGE